MKNGDKVKWVYVQIHPHTPLKCSFVLGFQYPKIKTNVFSRLFC